MVTLKEAILEFFTQHGKQTQEYKAANWIPVISGAKSESELEIILNIVPDDVEAIPSVKAAIDAKREEIKNNPTGGLLSGAAEELFKGFQALIPPIMEGTGTLFSSALEGGYGGVRDAFGSGGDFIFDALFEAIEAQGKPIPDGLKENIKRTLMPVITVKLTMEMAGVLAELMHPMKNMGLGGVAHVLHDTVGFNAVSDSIIKPFNRALIGFPMEQSINAAIQPFDPAPGEGRIYAQRRVITPEDYRDILRSDGLQEKYVEAATDCLWRELAMRDMQRMFDVSRPDPEWIKLKVQRMGFRDDDVDKIIASLNQRAVQKEIGDIRTLQRSQFKRGVITRADYAALLAGRGFSEAEVSEYLTAIEQERAFEDREHLIGLYEKKFLAGNMTAEDLSVIMLGQGRSQEYTDLRIELLNEQRIAKLAGPERERVLSRVDYVNAYKYGLMTREAAVQALDTMGYSSADADFIITLFEAAALAKLEAKEAAAAGDEEEVTGPGT